MFAGLRSVGRWTGSAYCWRRVKADTDLMSVKCWTSVASACQYPFSPSQYFMLAGLRAHIAYTALIPFKCWPVLDTMAWHRTNARYTDTLPAIPTKPAACFEPILG